MPTTVRCGRRADRGGYHALAGVGAVADFGKPSAAAVIASSQADETVSSGGFNGRRSRIVNRGRQRTH